MSRNRHFALTGRLIDQLLNTVGSRVVNVSSNGHRMGHMDFEDLTYDNGNSYSPVRAYGRSKLANLLFTYELQRRFEAVGADAIALGVHPGGSNTNLARHLYDRWYFRLFRRLEPVMMQSAAMGALPTMRAATDPNATGGQYFGPGGFMEQRGYPVAVESNDASHDEEVARQLWQASEQLTGVRFAPLDQVEIS